LIGWDDPRFLTLRGLHRRGIVPEAIHELVKKVGMSKAPTNLDFDVIASINRRILDEQANRYFFVEEPKKIVVADWPIGYDKVELKLHPHHRRGGRELHLDGEFYLAKKDYKKVLDGKPFRLIDTINLFYDKESKEFKVHSMSIDEFRALKEKHGLFHFLPVKEQHVITRIYSAEGNRLGLSEPAVAQLRPGAIVQFERQCFVRLDTIEEKDGKQIFTFWYSHD
jgi:glutamyl-tRNA synthetase